MKKFCFLQEWGTYGEQTFVIVGMNHKEIIRAMTARHFDKSYIQNYDERNCDSGYESAGFVYSCNGATVLWFRHWKNNWEHIEVLIHEISHLIFSVLGKHKGMYEETEAQAYQTEYLFHSIRKKLYALSRVEPKKLKAGKKRKKK